MKKQELELLVQTGDVESVVISRDWSKVGQGASDQASFWEAWAYGGDATAARGNVLCTARGERRLFRTLDTAYAFVRDCGFRGRIEVEERFRPADA